jgi:hypothetical protein
MTHERTYWYLSFADADRPEGDQFLGGCIVKAHSMKEAIKEAWRHGCNPGGEVVGHPVPPELEHNVSRFGINTLLTKQELLSGDA